MIKNCTVQAVLPPGSPGTELPDIIIFQETHVSSETALIFASWMVEEAGALWVEVNDSEGNLLGKFADEEVANPWRQA